MAASMQLAPTPELLAYFRSKMESFEAERAEYLKRLDDIELRHSDMHKKNWELHTALQTIRELQSALSDANVQLMEEKQLISNLYAELDEFKIQEMQDRKNIEDLLVLTQPVTEDVTLVRDRRAEVYSTRVLPQSSGPPPAPEATMSLRASISPAMGGAPNRAGLVVTMPVAGGGASVSGGSTYSPAVQVSTANFGGSRPATAPHAQTTANPGSAVEPYRKTRREMRGSRVLRTVYLPTAKTDALLLTIEQLREQLEDKSRALEEQKAVFLEDRRVRAEQEEARARQDAERVAGLEARARELDEKLLRVTREHLAHRHSAQLRERELTEALESTKAANDRLRLEVESAARRVDMEKSLTQSRIEEGTAMYTEHYRRQLAELNAEATELRNRNKDLTARNVALKESLRKLEERRELEMEGYGTDIGILKRSIKALEGRLPRPCAPHTRAARRAAAGLPPVDEPGRDAEVEGNLETLKDRVFLLETSFGRTRERLG
eukprot:tig00000254_g22580.t1